ncbi:16907_t:CDS:1, partial [Entrophospora sp. SA101]
HKIDEFPTLILRCIIRFLSENRANVWSDNWIIIMQYGKKLYCDTNWRSSG